MEEQFANVIRRDDLKPGDHIYSWRIGYLYAHHGVYIGDGNVIHFTRGEGHEIGTGSSMDRFLFSSSASQSQVACTKCGDQSGSNGVISSCLDCFLAGGELYLFQYGVSPAFFRKARGGTCTLERSNSDDEVIRRALHLLENGFGGYDLLSNNCEDFAIYCKTGMVQNKNYGRRGQVSSFYEAAKASAAAAGAATAFAVGIIIGKIVFQKK